MSNDQPQVKTVESYISYFDAPTQMRLKALRELVHELAPTATAGISYGMPTYKLDGKNMVHFAGYAQHIGFYPTPGTIAAFASELKPYVHAKGSVQFPLDQPFPTGLIRAMILHRRKAMESV